PSTSSGLTSKEALGFPAIQLFIERAAESLDAFELTDKDVLVIANICRRLDGIALAIELAAGRVDTFGVRGLAERLDDCFRILTRGRRTALPRHQTLSATLDWSYNFLSESERAVLRRVAVFAGAFTLNAAIEKVAFGQNARADIVSHLANLVAKSLVVADVHGTVAHYRLGDTTRAYCLQKLKQSGEWELVARRHAHYFMNLAQNAEAEWKASLKVDRLAAYSHHLENIRAALEWAFAQGGDTKLGVQLTIAAIPLWILLSLMQECRRGARRALDNAGTGTPEAMKLFMALGAALRFERAPDAEIEAVWTNALAIAEHLDDSDNQLRALCRLWILRVGAAKFREALMLAKKFKEVAATSIDRKDTAVSDRMIGFALHFLGEQAEARWHLERMIRQYGESVYATHIIRFGYDQRT